MVQLENLFNEELFVNNSIVKESNIANRGNSSEVGEVVLDYELFPPQVQKDPETCGNMGTYSK